GGPLVTVIMPTLNRPGMLCRALESILSQTYRNLEAIVVNDGGEDVNDVIAPFHDNRVVYLCHDRNRGRSAARNTGLKAAHGTYIAYLDDDDIYYPDHLETLVGFLEKSGAKVAYSDSYRASQTLITGRHVTVGKDLPYSFDFDRRQLLISNYIPINTVMHRKDLLDEAGLFDERLESHEDWDLLIRLSLQCDFHHIKYVTTEFRTRGEVTNTSYKTRADFLRTLRIIYKRYACLVTDATVLEAQKKGEEGFRIEVDNIGVLAAADEFEKKISLRYPAAESSALADAFTAFWCRYERQVGNFEELLRQRDGQVQKLEVLLQHKDAIIAKTEKYGQSLESRLFDAGEIMNREEVIQDKVACIKNLEARLNELESYVQNREDVIQAKVAEVDCRDKVLNSIYSSGGWRTLTVYYKIRDSILPAGTIRRVLAQRFLATLKKVGR
ncbi:MAG TPA: glycosyltransferase, partial [Dissulfurispiraceae bacterium]|nr:glycosyltransferase [Dissulfurispiraceae bacterium]